MSPSSTRPSTWQARTWQDETLSDDYLAWHAAARKDCVRDIVQMTYLAKSGHPGGSLSSLDFYLLLYSHANLDPAAPWMAERDRIVVSHGHTSPGVYSVLARRGYFASDEVIASFRRTHNVFEGHIERYVPGVEWTTGNLGQGLSAGAGMALANRLKNIDCQVFVPMGDGEQQKGQIAEARRFIRKFKLNHVTAIVDLNQKQIGGEISDIMPQDIAAGWASDGWQVTIVDGHDPQALHQALRSAVLDGDRPHVVLAQTIMGKGVSFMEGTHKYHGQTCSDEQYEQAARESGDDPKLWDRDRLRSLIADPPANSSPPLPKVYPQIEPGTARTYTRDQTTDNRSAFGNAIADVAEANRSGDFVPVVAFDCDLEGSVKLGAFHKKFPGHFIQSGIQEHHTATCAGALSVEGLVSVFADFGVFGVCETYNQHRLSDINHAHIKLACTHIGLDVGEDGRTHQNIDYVGVLANLYGMTCLVPADPNQTDRAVRHMMNQPGMFFLGMGRSKLPALLDDKGEPAFGGDYTIEPGRLDWLRKGSAGAVIAMGTLCGRALDAVDSLRAGGLDLGFAVNATPTLLRAKDRDELGALPFVATVEDHNVHTGLGAHLAQQLFQGGHAVRHLRLGVEGYSPSGSAEAVYASQELDASSIERRVREFANSR